MYLLGVKPWESAKFVIPSIDEMSGNVRKALEEAGGDPNVLAETERREGVSEDGTTRDSRVGGSDEHLREKEETQV